MRCLAIIQSDQPAVDSVILWEDQDRILAVAYYAGQVMITRPLEADNLETGILEAMDAFRVPDAQVNRLSTWERAKASRFPDGRWT